PTILSLPPHFSSTHPATTHIHTLSPTRRSSDLPGFEMLGGHRAEFLGGVPKEMFARGVGVRVYGSEGVRRLKIARLIAAAWPKQDRKSTRLNSSHVKISYAVFCLKKKKKIKKI